MKLSYLDKFADFILTIPIIERASIRAERISKIMDLSDTINEHLIKLYLFQKSRDRAHWKDEIEGWLSEIERITWDKHKKFEAEDYYLWLYHNLFYDKNNNLKTKLIESDIKKLTRRYEKEPSIKWKADELISILEYFWKKTSPLLQDNYDVDSIYEYLDKYFDIE